MKPPRTGARRPKAKITGRRPPRPAQDPRRGHVLAAVLARVRDLARAGRAPIVVFDLDHTLLDNAPRTKAIMLDLAREHANHYPGLATRVRAVRATDLPFSHAGCLAAVGLDPEGIRALRPELARRFFSSDYLHHDVPVPGASAYVRRVIRAGARVVYLTGRDRPGMEEGTVRSLRARRFPLEDARVSLVMKPDSVRKDWEFKQSVQEDLARTGTLAGFFDNEPANANAFRRAFPEAIIVLLDTKHSAAPPRLARGIHAIGDFR